MLQPLRSPSAPHSHVQGDLILVEPFDYTPLTTDMAQELQTAAQRIRQLVQRTLDDLLVVGQELLAVKDALPHGQFGPWLRAEFGWTERTARHFMTVAQRFGPKPDMISDLPIEPTAAYLLAAPSAPREAMEIALRLAQQGEKITAAVAKSILGTLRKKPLRPTQNCLQLPAGKLLGQLLESLESFRQRWHPRQYALLARQLREFADSLQEQTEQP
jgi:hypothetical protein